MIGQVIDAVRQRAGFADVFSQSDDTLTAAVDASGEELARSASRQLHLRVESQGRLGLAVRDDSLVEPLVESAFQSARYGAESALLAPAPAPLPPVLTTLPATGLASGPDLLGVARLLRDRLLADRREVWAWAERSSGRVDIANTLGVMTGYDAGVAGAGVRLRISGPPGPLLLRMHESGLSLPDEAALSRLVDQVEERLAPPLLDPGPGDGAAVTIWLAPRAVGALLVPLCQALLARHVWSEEGPLAGMVGEQVVSPLLTLIDDSLADGRPGSRPVDDEGVVCRRLTLIRKGVLAGALADLANAERYGVPATGHGRRSPGGPPWTGWSNLVLEAGDAGRDALAAAAGDGILIQELPFPHGQCFDGRIALPTPWAYRVERGEVTGRYERVVIKGNVFAWLNQVIAVGAERNWIGARLLPELVIEGVEVF